MTRANLWAKVRFLASWVVALVLLALILPRVVDVSWHGVLPVLASVHWPSALTLTGLWLLGLWVHTFVLTAAAPDLTHRRALTLNLTGSAVSNVVPLGGAAGVELNRRMMRAWGIDGRAFTGYTFLTNLWDVASKLLLPVIAAITLARAETLTPQVRTASLIGGIGFVAVVIGAALLLTSVRTATALGRILEATIRGPLKLLGRDRELGLPAAALEIRAQCAELVAQGWVRMSLGMSGYVLLQGVLLAFCLHLTGASFTWPELLAAFAVERALTVVPITPGGIGVADLGLVGVLLTLGGDPAAVTAGAVLYRAFIFAVEIPVGSGALGAWLLGQRLRGVRRTAPASYASPPRRIAHVTDVFLPRLGGIETHVDDLVRHQRAIGLDAEVLTPPRPSTDDPAWVRRLNAATARREIAGYDAVHVHLSMFSPYGLSTLIAATRAGVPVLVTVHSMWTGAGGLLRMAALTGATSWPVEWSAVSTAAAENFGRSFGGTRISVLPNAIDTSAWRHAAPPASVSGPVTLISVMRLMPRKRPGQLLAMFEQVRRLTGRDDLRLVIVGDGPLRRRLERKIHRRGLQGQVRVTGRVTRAEVAEALASASIYVAPAPKESFGIAALEARASGLPVVAHRKSGVRDFITDGVDGMLTSDDSEMVLALTTLVTDRAARQRITDHNRALVPPFDWADALTRTEELYRAAAARIGELAPAPASASAEVVALEA